MTEIRTWLDKGDKSSQRMPRLLPILIRQAHLEVPITYGAAALELGVHHRAIHHIAGYIGYTLAAIGAKRGWKRRPPPPLHALIVNDITRLPGRGINGFMEGSYRRAKGNDAKRAVLKAVYAAARNYPHWAELCTMLAVPFNDGVLADAVEKARGTSGRGGEGPAHLALKLFVRDNPHIVGLAPGSPAGKDEYPTASGDWVDVVFERRGLGLAVEVKPHHAPEGDMLRGVFQCLKYRIVLEAEAALKGEDMAVRALLVLGRAPTEKVVEVANRLGVSLKSNVGEHLLGRQGFA